MIIRVISGPRGKFEKDDGRLLFQMDRDFGMNSVGFRAEVTSLSEKKYFRPKEMFCTLHYIDSAVDKSNQTCKCIPKSL